jgi:Flp pilus assembly protein TadG
MRSRKRGSSLLEFLFVGIPMLFVTISAVEMSLGMWQYATLAYAIHTGSRSAVSKGKNCTSGTNSCGTTVGAITTLISNTAIGIPASSLNVTLTTASGAVTTCNPITNCTSSTAAWPPSTNGDNAPGQLITVTGNFVFNTALVMFYPGSKPVTFSPATLQASASEPLMF